MFEPIDKKNKIYSRKAAQTPAFHLPARKERGEHLAMAKSREAASRPKVTNQGEPEGFRAELNSQREADRITINKYSPPGVLVNAELQILQFRGPTGAYLEPPTGKASFDVLKMAREGLMLPLRTAINRAKKDNKPVRRENVRVGQNGGTRAVNIEVVPLKNLRERCFLILFEDADRAARASGAWASEQPSAPAKATRNVSARAEARRSAELERELAEMRDYLQSILEQHDAANEELQASNEEVQSANEELQSINEELETSKEEMESANEELTTVNEEMASRNTELNRLNSDLSNLQTSTKLAILLLGRDLAIRRFSVQAEKQFNLLATDIGRPVGRMRHDLDVADLEEFVEGVIANIRESEREVRGKDGHWYSLRVRPYLTLDNKVDGAVLVLVDIDELKRAEDIVTEARDYAEATLSTARDPLVVLSGDLRFISANDAFYKTFKVSAAESEGRLIYELGGGQWNIPRLRELLEEVPSRNSIFNDFEVTLEFERLGRRSMLLNARTLQQTAGKPKRILLGIQDVTEMLQVQTQLRAQAEELTRFNRAAVGRETRMIELKKEINELCRRQGEPARYPLEFEQGGGGTNG